jgi:hypothetical protein
MNMAGVLIISSRRLTSTEFGAQKIRTTVNVTIWCDEKGLKGLFISHIVILVIFPENLIDAFVL